MNPPVFATIKAILFDVDGVLTKGEIILDSQGNELKKFNVKDGQLISFLQRKGVFFGAISGRKSKALDARLEELKIDFRRTGVSNKSLALHEFIEEFHIDAMDICFIGDDIIDLKLLKLCGIAVCPQDASDLIKPFVHFVTQSKGGEGVLREVIDKMIIEKGWLNELLEC